jgi:hypothetical protein
MHTRTLFAAAPLFTSLVASTQSFACGYSSSDTMGSNDCTGGATARDSQAMSDIRAAMAAQRELAAQERAQRAQQRQ